MLSTRSLLLVILVAASAQAQEDQARPRSTAEQRLLFARQAAEAYRFRFGGRDKSEVVLNPEPLLRWNNQVVREDDGMLFLWARGQKGRPVAAAQFFLVDTLWHHEFQSLCEKPFEARFPGAPASDWSWEPGGAGLEFVRSENAGAPGASARERLRQMKAIAERFTAMVDPGREIARPEQLRVLTTPLYRYSAKDEGILDGALFAIVQGTNPEVLILLEADTSDPASPFWRHGFARMSSFRVRVFRGGETVWERQKAEVPTRERTSPYFFRWSAQPDRSAEVKSLAPRDK
jgi:hypothetical protein